MNRQILRVLLIIASIALRTLASELRRRRR